VSKRYTTKQSTPWCQDICVLYTWNGLAGEWQSEKPEIYKNIPKTDVNLEDFPDFFEALEEIKEPSDEKARINKLAEWLHHVENPYGVILWEQWESTQNVYRNTAKTLLPHMKESFFEEKKPILKVSECGHIHPYCSHDSPVEFLSKKECEHEWETDYTVESPDQIKCSKCGEVTTV